MAGQQEQAVRIDQPLLRVGAQEVLRVADDELVEREAGAAKPSPPTRPSPGSSELLPRGGDGSWISDENRGLQAADVDAQLEGVGADDRGDIAVAQAGLDLTTVQRQVAGTIPAHSLGGVEARGEVLAQVAQH